MKQSTGRGKSRWFWVGLALLPIVAILWFALIPAMVAEPNIANIIFVIIFLTLLTAVPVGIMVYGIYSVRHVSKEPPVEIKLGSEPTYLSEPAEKPTQEMQQRPEPAYASQPTMKPAQTYTGFFGKIREKLRDKTIENLCDYLCAMGLNARMAERRRTEEKMILNSGTSLGLIEIRDRPIRWVNVRKHATGENTADVYTNVYLVPDRRVPKRGYLELKSVRVRNVPLFGRVVDLRWKPKFVRVMIKSMPTLTRKSVPVKMESKLIGRVIEDVSLKESLIRLNEDVTIRSLEDWGWAISTSVKSRQPPPSRKQWDCYETIARHLLEAEEGELI